jgi:hypothetical protein
MSNIDQFESVFRSAIRDIYEYKEVKFSNFLLITDLDQAESDEYANQVKQFFRTIHIAGTGEWTLLNKADFSSTQNLLEAVARISPDLIFTYRNLHSQAWKHPHSLGEHLDVLIQKTETPVFILPHPDAGYALDYVMKDCDVVMALTDHLSNDHDLVNHAVEFTQDKGSLYLVHIEDADTFDRYIDAISKIQTIDTDDAKEKLSKELLKQPANYIQTVIDKLKEEQLNIDIKFIVNFGHHLTEFRKHINDYKVDLLVINAKDHQQMAMHGLAYPLAIELRQIPLLMI